MAGQPEHVLKDRLQPYTLKARRARAGKIQKIRKQPVEPLAFTHDDAQALRVFGIELVASGQDGGGAGNARQRISEIAVDASRRFQTMEGFGATFNEAGLMALNQLPKDAQETVLHAMFGRNNAGWTLMKAPVAACDFASAGPWYTYDDTPGDVGLKSFSIARDLKPNGMATFIKRAKQHGEFRIHSTTDYPPDWMLDAKMSLKPEFYPAFARYLLKYVEAYRAQGIKSSMLTGL